MAAVKSTQNERGTPWSMPIKRDAHIGIGGCAQSVSTYSDSISWCGEVLHEQEGFYLRENRYLSDPEGNGFPSIIQHECSEKSNGAGGIVRKLWQGTWSAIGNGECQRCHVKIPEGLLTLWTLHCWEAIQQWNGGQHGEG